jgi:hypothetical protein
MKMTKELKVTKPKKMTNRQIIEEAVAEMMKKPKGPMLALSDPHSDAEEDTGPAHYGAEKLAEMRATRKSWNR